MRKIIFRGKLIHNGEWEEGYLAASDMISPSFEDGFHVVDPATVGQYIGLEDANGNKIFEGDILCRKYELDNDELRYVAVVEYGEFNCSCCNGVYGWTYNRGDIRYYDNYVVIGNIHDNHDLIEAMEGRR